MLVNVHLIGAVDITQMDDSLLKKRTITIDDERENTEVIEYWIDFNDERAVHRSVHVHSKQVLFSDAQIGAFNG